MHALEKKTLKTIRQENLLQAGEKTVIAVSGGPDSMALLYVLARLRSALDITLAAVYVNHGLRPGEAEKEETLVAATANGLGLDFFSGAVDVKGLAAGQKFSIEHAARLLRYDFLERTAREYGARKIALAHTADDQAEELLLRLVRGTGRKGLSGMKTFRAGRFIRPFLHFPKSDLLAYLAAYSIPFQLDSSNTENIYLRNRIRNQLLPYLTERYNPDIRQTLTRTAAILQDEEEFLERLTATAFTQIVSITGEEPEQMYTSIVSGNAVSAQTLQLSLDLFALQPRALQRRLLEKCCWKMACEPRSRQIEQLLQLATQSPPEGSLHLSDGLRVAKSKEHLTFTYPQGRRPLRGSLSTGTGGEIPETGIPAPGTYAFPALDKRLLVEDIEDTFPKSGDFPPTGEYLDSALFSFPLTLRSPKPGDRFHPLGAPGSKKLFDFLSEQKIDRHDRSRVPVLCVDDTILALPGLRIDHRYRITGQTTHAVRVRWEEME